MENFSSADEGHAEGIVGAVSYEASRPQKKDFLPWHRPRKQFVRHHQWCEQIGLLLDEVQLEGNILKYLGLPGVDLLDLRYFHNIICSPRNLRLRFLGFNSGAGPNSEDQTELNISLDEVTKLALVDQGSEIIPDDFCRMATEDSLAWEKTKAVGPYDVVNLDLCDGFGKHTPGTLEETHYNALNRLLALQARNKNPWLLLLTTRVGNGHIHPEVLQKLLDKYLKNLTDCQPFQAISAELFSIRDEAELRQAIGTGNGLLAVFLVGLCKWLVGLAVSQRPPTKVEVKSVIGYRVNEGAAHEDLISLAIKFHPTLDAGVDPAALANTPVAMPDECSLAVKVAKRIARRKDADQLLASDSVLMEDMTASTIGLLELARYDVAAYREWLQQPG